MQASEMLTFASALGTKQKVPKERKADLMNFGLIQLVTSRPLLVSVGVASDARHIHFGNIARFAVVFFI
ncbi:hypothetical protein SAMN02927930_02147 [Pseudidiomarina indica]|uniref:Uncharacterized protein n=1 Tax=Pseudidiomarina indica TaxID=1159017 RepID=A0A1G6EC38_9GAMM|nr:hypothetical protein SAMN02927930_02147 [Pseudidiomarina indica]